MTLASLLSGDWEALLRAGIGMAALYAFYFVLRLVRPDGMGGGDVKLAGLVGMYLGYIGWGALAVGAFAAFVLGGVYGIALIAARGSAGGKSQDPVRPMDAPRRMGRHLHGRSGRPLVRRALHAHKSTRGSGDLGQGREFMGKSIVGLEVTEESVRAAEVTLGRTPQLLAYGEVPLAPEAAKDSEVLDPGAVAVALRQLWTGARFKSKDVVLGVASRRILVREYTTQAMRPDMLREALPYQVQDLLPVPASQAVLDFYPLSQQGDQVSGLLVAAVAETIEQIIGTLGRVKLRATGGGPHRVRARARDRAPGACRRRPSRRCSSATTPPRSSSRAAAFRNSSDCCPSTCPTAAAHAAR